MYISEIRLNWRPLLASSIGMGLGSALGHYTMSLFGPALIAQFGWSKAQFALVDSLPLIMLVLVPVAGRFTDRFGARVAAIVGFTVVPLGCVAFSLMSGNIVEFFAIWVIQHIFGILTTTLVFCRIAVERFDHARGVALSIVMSAPPLAGAIVAPMLGRLIDAHGWRTGYIALALITGAGGLLSILLMGQNKRRTVVPGREQRRLTRQELGQILRHPVLLLVLGGMFLVNIPQVLASSQLKLVVMDNGITSGAATWMTSLYAMGVIVGRLLSGLALDRVRAHFVAIAAVGLPAIGFLIIASHVSTIAILALAVMIIGFKQGTEGDIGAYILSRQFDLKNFSLLLSFIAATVGVGTALGSLLLSATLYLTGSYETFLLVAAGMAIAGAACFAMTGRYGGSAGTLQATSEELRIEEQAIAVEIDSVR